MSESIEANDRSKFETNDFNMVCVSSHPIITLTKGIYVDPEVCMRGCPNLEEIKLYRGSKNIKIFLHPKSPLTKKLFDKNMLGIRCSLLSNCCESIFDSDADFYVMGDTLATYKKLYS